MYEDDFWCNFRDGLLKLYGDEYSLEDILCAYTYIFDKFFEILKELEEN